MLLDSDRTDWRADSTAFAEVVGRGDQLDDALAAYEGRVDDLAGTLEADDRTVSVVRVLPEGVRAHTRYHFSGQIIDDLGLARPADQQTDDPSLRYIELSDEELERADADVIFVFGAGTSPSEQALA